MFVVKFITKFGESLPPCQKNSAQVQQSALGELGSRAANRSVNPELICPLYILWPRRIRVGLDPLSPDPRPVVARSQPSLFVARPVVERYPPSLFVARPVVAQATLVAAQPCTHRWMLRTCRRPIFFKFPYPSSHAVHPSSRVVDLSSRAATRRCALQTRRWALHTHRRDPSRTRPISTWRFFFSPHSVRASRPAFATATACGIL